MEQRCKSNPSNLQHKPSSYKNDEKVEILKVKYLIFRPCTNMRVLGYREWLWPDMNKYIILQSMGWDGANCPLRENMSYKANGLTAVQYFLDLH